MAANRATAKKEWASRIIGHGEESPDQLLANPRNFRRHPTRQREALRGSLDSLGWIDSVIVNQRTGYVLDGHARIEEAISKGIATVPVSYVDLSEEEEKLALAVFDPIGAMAEADRGALESLLNELGPQEERLQRMLEGMAAENRIPLAGNEESGEGETAIDRAAELQRKWGVERGDLWECGRHRVLCGDCTLASDVNYVLAGARPFLCVTDPPYGVNYDPGWRNVEAAKGNLAYAASRIGPVTNDNRADWREAWNLFPGDVIYSWHPAGATSLVHATALQDSGFTIRMQIIWAKSNFPIGRGDYHVRHEPCWYCVRDGKAAHRTDDRTQTTLWEINLDRNVDGGHSTQKPLECMARPIRNHEAPEVYDPFLGSGTTMIACEQLNRCCFGIEIEPSYVAVCLERWHLLTGEMPEKVPSA